MTDYVNLTIDDQSVTVPKGTTVFTAAKQLGIEVPIFCYQDRMPPFGACRVCLVEVDKMPKLQTSCTLEATDGMVVRTQAKGAVKAREDILELLLINHPLDCPICDRGGECPLQDQVTKFGPGESRFYEEKRHFEKALPLGPVLTLDRERCIACARCTRFGDVVAGDHGLEFIDRGYKTEVGTADGEAPKSKFIGNTIMICPVGALTSSVYRFRARPWDNLSVDSTCTLCPVGCSLTFDSRDGEIMRTRSKETPAVNDIWMCDKGWFGYEFSAHKDRLTQPLIRRDGTLQPVSWDEAFSFVAAKIREAKPNGKIAALGGSTLTIEENYLFQKLIRDVCGSPHIDHRVGMPIVSLADEGLDAGMEIAIGDVESLSHVILLGLDISEEFPVLWLRLKQAINKGAKVHFYGHFAPEMARYFASVTLHPPGDEVSILQRHEAEFTTFAQAGQKCALFVGRQYLATPERKNILKQLLTIQKQHPICSLNILEGKDNSLGARLAGMHPELKPLGRLADKLGMNTAQIMQTAATQGLDLLYVVGADIASKCPSDLWNEACKKLGCLIVQDLFMTKTAEAADVVLPSLGFVEKGGSFLNIEARVQKLKPGKSIPKGVYADSYIFVRIAQRLGTALVMDEQFIETLKPGRLPLTRPLLIEASTTPQKQAPFMATFVRKLFDQGTRMKHNEHLVQLARSPKVGLHPSHDFCEGEQVRLCANDKIVTAQVTLDEKIAPGTVVLPLGFTDLPVHEFGINLLNGLALEICRKI